MAGAGWLVATLAELYYGASRGSLDQIAKAIDALKSGFAVYQDRAMLV